MGAFVFSMLDLNKLREDNSVLGVQNGELIKGLSAVSSLAFLNPRSCVSQIAVCEHSHFGVKG